MGFNVLSDVANKVKKEAEEKRSSNTGQPKRLKSQYNTESKHINATTE